MQVRNLEFSLDWVFDEHAPQEESTEGDTTQGSSVPQARAHEATHSPVVLAHLSDHVACVLLVGINLLIIVAHIVDIIHTMISFVLLINIMRSITINKPIMEKMK